MPAPYGLTAIGCTMAAGMYIHADIGPGHVPVVFISAAAGLIPHAAIPGIKDIGEDNQLAVFSTQLAAASLLPSIKKLVVWN